MSISEFYDGLAPIYHLIYPDWETSVARQGADLAGIIDERWGPDARRVVDAAVGIGTQALGLLAQGFHVTGSDLSFGAVARAGKEAAARRLSFAAVVSDFRALPFRSASADVVLVADNALPHLDSPAEIRSALAECLRCARPGGGCLVSLRDYGVPPPAGTVEVKPYGERVWDGRQYAVRQVWTWRGPRYDLAFEFTPTDGTAADAMVFRGHYFAIPVGEVAELMRAVGFADVRRIDGRFFQPVIVGTRP
jgi:SAM-dependent methyltransferase